VAKKHNVKAVREAIAALDQLDVPGSEIHKRLVNDEAGLGYPVDIARRTVYYHLRTTRLEKARATTALDSAAESVAAAKQRAVDLICRELHELELTAPGKMTANQVPVVERLYKALVNMEKDERRANKGKYRAAQTNGQTPAKEETLWDRLAREQRDAAQKERQPT
jgi:hypothetical protein